MDFSSRKEELCDFSPQTTFHVSPQIKRNYNHSGCMWLLWFTALASLPTLTYLAGQKSWQQWEGINLLFDNSFQLEVFCLALCSVFSFTKLEICFQSLLFQSCWKWTYIHKSKNIQKMRPILLDKKTRCWQKNMVRLFYWCAQLVCTKWVIGKYFPRNHFA